MTRSCDAVRDMKSSGSCEVDRDTGSDKSLSVLLEEEYFLLKVLSYVVEDGLHECRLVCRRWRDACGKLPVQLRTKGIPSAKLPKAADLFPETKTLNLCEWTLSADVIERHVVTHLPRLKNLKHFSLFLYGESIDLRNLVAALSKKIVDLELSSRKTFPKDLPEELVDLTNLTSLRMHSDRQMRLFHSDALTPIRFFNGLRQLKTLTLWNACLDRPSLDAFAAMTGLTELNLGGRYAQMDDRLVCQQLCLLSNLKMLAIPVPEMLIDSEVVVSRACLPKIRRIESSFFYVRHRRWW